MTRFKNVLAPMLLVLLFGAVLIRLPVALADRTSDYSWFNPIIDTRRILLDRFVEEIDEDAMQLAILRAMTESVDDPYTVYVPPADEETFQKDLTGTYVGIGAEVNMIDGYLTIITPMPDSPALEAGVLPGDIVLEIEGESTYGLAVEECINRLLGAEGTEVEIRVRHLDGQEADLTVTRRRIIHRTVRGIQRLDDGWDHWLDRDAGIGYVRITQFIDRRNGELTTAGEVENAVRALLDDGMNGLVVDLRDNPGGSLDSAIQVADLFLQSGTIVAVRSPRTGEGRSWDANARGTLPQVPMVIIVNQASASASEIVAGALRDNDRARILGMRTFGKGSVQEVRPLPDHEGTLKYTTAYYYLPSGRNLHRKPDSTEWGVDPHPGLVVAMTDEAYVEMMRRRRPFEVLGQSEGDTAQWSSIEWLRNEVRDEQLAGALQALQTHLAGEPWPTIGDEDSGAVAVAQDLQRYSEARNRILEQLAEIDNRIQDLRTAGDAVGVERLLPEEADPRDGVLTLRDREGHVIGQYRVMGGDVERALGALRLEPVDSAPADGAAASSADDAP